ncbi:MAG: LPXTG cell wall anchor domain-containing protein, partial [Erysipelotrichaceae bacterium]|nr:LPXTG cell wall anchor domain-containing protein [Erysipelotrichaceae bacterium]
DLGGFSNPIIINSTTPFSFIVGNDRIVVPQPEPVVEEVVEEEVPLATPLPQTGEIPPYFAYGFGSLLILAGIYLKRKF